MMQEASEGQGENRLANASSAYLRSARHQPVDWYEFGDAAFQRAEALDRLILLDIGAVWCHWCHVIDRESYENAEIAELINAHYVPVKVDRDARPDIDIRYQQVVAAMTGQGGWPLTAFLTFDGRVLYGGTYFPPHVMKKLLNQLKDVYQDQKADILKDRIDQVSADDRLKELDAAEAAEATVGIPEDIFNHVFQAIQHAFDVTTGGFGNRPKFPHYSVLGFLLRMPPAQKNPTLQTMLDKTLTGMAQGGLYDHIGGGFHRYSVDAEWHVPHFEKMAYGNAEALSVYAQAYRQTGKPLFRDTALGILRFLETTLSDQAEGGFYATQDADINLDDDGDYFTWTIAEIQAVLIPDEAALALRYYDVTDVGDMRERPGRNVLRVCAPLETIALALKLSVDTARQRLDVINLKLAAARAARPTPFVDTTLYLNWNGMLLSGALDAAILLDLPETLAFCFKTINRLLETHVDTHLDRLIHSTGVAGLLEDYAWWIRALLKAYQASGEAWYLASAQHWMHVAEIEFGDAQYGGYFDTPLPSDATLGLLKFRRKPTDDSPSSSANGMMVANLLTLFQLTDGEESAGYLARAKQSLSLFGTAFAARGLHSASLVTALYDHEHQPVKIDVSGSDPRLLDAARKAYAPGKLLRFTPSPTGANELRICIGTRCLTPLGVNDVGRLQTVLNGLYE